LGRFSLTQLHHVKRALYHHLWRARSLPHAGDLHHALWPVSRCVPSPRDRPWFWVLDLIGLLAEASISQIGRAKKSLRTMSAELEKAGYLNERGQPYNPNSIKFMLES